jgi:hypothetical protein
MEAKLTRLTHKSSDTTALSGREQHHLQFSLQVACPETFGYTLVLQMKAENNGYHEYKDLFQCKITAKQK